MKSAAREPDHVRQPVLTESNQALETLKLDIAFSDFQVDVDWFRMLRQTEVANENWHGHSGLEIHFLISGEHDFYFLEDHVHLSSGYALLIPQGKMHRVSNPNGKEFLRFVAAVTIHATEKGDALFLQKALMRDQPAILAISPEVEEMLRKCAEETENRVAGYVTVIKLSMLQILFALARALAGRPQADSASDVKLTYSQLTVQNILKFIERRARDGVTIGDISAYMHLSSKHVQRLIQKEYQCTAKELIDGTRLQMAKNYLKNTQMSINQISEAMGFSSTQSFCRFYKNAEGQTPNQYRKGAMGMN